jgi:hypothetical protein
MVQWASIEMFCACVVANAAFYYALLKDLSRGHSKSSSQMTALAIRQSTIQRIQSNDKWNSQQLPREITSDSLIAPAATYMNSWKGFEDTFPAATHIEER